MQKIRKAAKDKLCRDGIAKFQSDEDHFQIDQLLLHPKYGILLFEVKHGEGSDAQIKRMKEKLAALWKIVANGEMSPPVTMVLCTPNDSTRGLFHQRSNSESKLEFKTFNLNRQFGFHQCGNF